MKLFNLALILLVALSMQYVRAEDGDAAVTD